MCFFLKFIGGKPPNFEWNAAAVKETEICPRSVGQIARRRGIAFVMPGGVRAGGVLPVRWRAEVAKPAANDDGAVTHSQLC